MSTLANKLDHHAERAVQLWHHRRHYGYQQPIRRAIISALIKSRAGERVVIPIEIPRQSGKTQAIVDTVEFVLTAHRRYINTPIAIGIFAPQREQATTDFERLRMQFADLAPLGFTTKIKVVDGSGQSSRIQIPEKWNSKTIRIYQGDGQYLAEVYIFPISKTSRSESKSFGLLIIEEAQDVDDYLMKNMVFPMGASTNAPRILIGTAGTRNCYFKQQLDTNPLAIRIPLEQVFADRQAMHELTGDDGHLLYQRYVEGEIAEHGRDSDYIQRQYFCKWIIGTGQFLTPEKWQALQIPGKYMQDIQPGDKHYFGLDTAKHPDRTVCTVLRAPRKPGDKSRIAGVLSLSGTNYDDQFQIITDWLQQFPNIRAGAIDSTGQGDFMPDLFERRSSYNILRVKFTAESKDAMYKNLEHVIYNELTQIPQDGGEDWQRFRKEMMELEREYKGRLLSVHHPERDSEGVMGHDDYADAWCLAEWAMAETAKAEPSISFA